MIIFFVCCVMTQIAIQKQQHLLEKSRAPREPIRNSVNTLGKARYTAEDLMGLSWALFEGRK